MATMDDLEAETPRLHGMKRKVLRSELGLARDHLLRLDSDGRHRRFGHDVSDGYIQTYALKMADIGNLAFGYFIDGQIRAIAELKQVDHLSGLGWGQTAEAAFSVERDYANKGLATLLMGQVIRSARNRGIRHLMLYCMADNAKMQSIARKYHAELRIEDGSVMADIVPKRFDYLSIAGEAFDDRLGCMHAMMDLRSRLIRQA
jgi:GNAT superfamily N-acetyltransferase